MTALGASCPPDEAQLRAGWARDVRSLGTAAPEDDILAAGADLLRRWAEPQRRYHRTRHLEEVLTALVELEGAGELTREEAALARVAAWLHDAVYDPGAAPGANEAASAALAEQALGRLGLPPQHVAAVAAVVRMTADHIVRSDSRVERAVHDADLWVLAAPERRFDEYCDQVREEYAAVPADVFRPARAAVLRALAGSGGLYLTAHARGQWERLAQDNIARELARLS